MNSRFKSFLTVMSICLIAVVLIADTKDISISIREASHMCADTVIPSLFPFLVLSAFIVNSGIITTASKPLAGPCHLIFNLPSEAGIAIIMGLIGGFPVGSKTTADLYKNKNITKEQAKRMMLFTINAGPAFVIGTVGVEMLGSARIGVLLYTSMVVSSITLGIIVCSKKMTYKTVSKDMYGVKSATSALTKSVESATKSMISICAYIIIFSAFIYFSGRMLENIQISNPYINSIIYAILEVTRGCKSLSVYITQNPINTLPLMSAFLSFSGFCVHCQVLEYVRSVELSYAKFLLARIAGAFLAALFCRMAIVIKPETFLVFSNFSENVTSTVSLSIFACISLLLTAILLIFDLDIDEELC